MKEEEAEDSGGKREGLICTGGESRWLPEWASLGR